jgi:HEAT repeat protein
VLIEALRADDEVLRWIAADCLGDIGPPAAAAAAALEEALNGNFQIAHVRTGIKLALERIKTSASADAAHKAP